MTTGSTTMTPDLPASPDDEALLDVLFDRIVELLEDGGSPCAAELVGERRHLLPRVDELIRLARQIKPDAGQPLPQVPGYTVLRELGRGGMGAVFLARQDRLAGRLVALKALPPSVALSPRARERFRNEAYAIARLSHPHIVAVHDVVAADGLHAYAMEWVDGESLAEWIAGRRGGRRHGGESRVSGAGRWTERTRRARQRRRREACKTCRREAKRRRPGAPRMKAGTGGIAGGPTTRACRQERNAPRAAQPAG